MHGGRRGRTQAEPCQASPVLLMNWILVHRSTHKHTCIFFPLAPQVQTVNIKSLGADYELVDGERLQLAVKDLGSSDLYPQVG